MISRLRTPVREWQGWSIYTKIGPEAHLLCKWTSCSGKSPLFCIYCPSSVSGKRVLQSPMSYYAVKRISDQNNLWNYYKKSNVKALYKWLWATDFCAIWQQIFKIWPFDTLVLCRIMQAIVKHCPRVTELSNIDKTRAEADLLCKSASMRVAGRPLFAYIAQFLFLKRSILQLPMSYYSEQAVTLHRLVSLIHISAQSLLCLLRTQRPFLQHIVNALQLNIPLLLIHLRQFLFLRFDPGCQRFYELLLGRDLFVQCLSRSPCHIYLSFAP